MQAQKYTIPVTDAAINEKIKALCDMGIYPWEVQLSDDLMFAEYPYFVIFIDRNKDEFGPPFLFNIHTVPDEETKSLLTILGFPETAYE